MTSKHHFKVDMRGKATLRGASISNCRLMLSSPEFGHVGPEEWDIRFGREI
jgi:hypothetical protein